nr:uncharacterized mitochondrial protein AtMg00810-like [Tanacetum cinerariifolium]
MDQDSAHMVAASKVSMLKPGKYEIWRMRIEQYIQMIDYALWEVIKNGETLPKHKLWKLKFNSIKDAKKLMEAVEKRFGRNAATKKTQKNLLKQQYENFTALSLEMLDQTFGRLQDQPNSPQLVHEDLEQIHPDDIEEMDLRWQMAMLTMRAKRECRAQRNQDKKHKKSSRRSVSVETSAFTALMSCDGLGGYDWSDQAEEWPNYALMAFSFSSSNSKVSNGSTGSKSCLEIVKLLKSQNDQLLKDLKKSELMVLGNFMPLTPDLSFTGLDKFVKKPIVKNCKAKSSEEETKGNPQMDLQDQGVIDRGCSRFSESTPDIVGSGLDWLFDIDALTRTMNYETIVAGTRSNAFADLKSSHDDGSKPSSDNGKKVDDDPTKENDRNDQKKEDNVNNTNNVNTVSSTINVAGTNKGNELPFDPNMPVLEDVGIFNFLSDDEDDGAVADMNNLDTTIQKFRFTEVKTASTPKETQKPLLKDEDGKEVDVHMYRSLIGSLMYLISSRPGIMFAVCACARYQVNPKVSHLHVVKRIFRYLKGQPGQPKLGLWYPKDSPFDLVAYTDSDYAGASLDRKSTTGDGKEIVITESPVKRDLQLADEKGIDCLPNSTIFEQLALMWFLQIFLDHQVDGVPTYKRTFSAPSHAKKIFGNMKRIGKSFSSRVTHLFPIMVIQNQSELGEGSAMPIDPHHKPTSLQPSSSQPQKTQKRKKPKIKDTQVPQPSGPTYSVVDEAAHKKLGDRLVRAATTASSLEAEQNNETIRDTTAQTRFGSVSKHSNDSLLARGNTLQSDEDSLKLNELMELCTNLQNRVLDLEKTKTSQRNEIDSLKRRVKKLEQRNSLGEDASKHERRIDEDASKQGKMIDAIDVDDEIILVNDADNEMFDVDDLGGEEVFVAEQKVVSTAATTKTITTEEITLAQALKALKTSKPKANRIVFHEPGEELIQESTKKQKVEDDKEKAELKQLMETIPDEADVAIDDIPLAIKVHSLRMQSMQIYMLVEKKYPLRPPTLSMMRERKLQIDYERRKRKHIELEPEVEVSGLDYDRSLPESFTFVNNMVIEEPEYGILFTDVFGGSDQDAKDALSKLLQMGTVTEYESKSNPTTLGEAFFRALITKARFEDERSTTYIVKTNNLNAGVQVQDLEKTIRHKPDKVEAFQTNDAKPPISTDTFGSNGGNDSRTSGSETPAKEVVDNRIESGSDQDAKDALSKLLQMGTVTEYETEARFTNLQPLELLRSNPTTLGEAFFRALITKARFEDESNGGNDSRTSGSETSAKEVVDNRIESEVVVGLPEEFQEGDMVDALSRVEQKSLGNWKELDNESKDRKVERNAKRKGEPTILATFDSDRGVRNVTPSV